MAKEIKICLPPYKIIYSLIFTAVFCLIQGVSFTFEIGGALEPFMAILAVVLCTDTYVQEIMSNRLEVESLYPMKNRMSAIVRRIGIQEIYLLILSAAGYEMFYIFQSPIPFCESEGSFMEGEFGLFLIYIGAVLVTLVFWGLLSLLLSGFFRNIWAGIGGCFILWIITYSRLGEKILGKWNLFSYALRPIEEIEDLKDVSWIWGKFSCLFCILLMITALPQLMKKRG